MTHAKVKDSIEGAAEFISEPPRPLYRELSPPGPFPTGSLGATLEAAAFGVHDQTNAPLAMCCQSVLAAATLAVQAHADLELPMGQVRPISAYFLTIAASGERKSAVDNVALQFVRKREVALREAYTIDYDNWLNEFDIWTKARAKILKDNTGEPATKGNSCVDTRVDLKALGPKPKEPMHPILTCPEPTFEGLCRLFSIGHPSLGVFSAEGGQFIGGHGMAEDNKLKTSSALSSIWDGEPIKRVRSGDGASTLAGRRAAMHLMAQPDVAARMLSDRVLADQGLLSRFLVVAPISTAGTRFFREIAADSRAAVKRFEDVLLLALETPPSTIENKPNELDPPVLRLSSGARRMWISYANFVEEQLAPDGAYIDIRGLANKLPEHAARLAAVLTLVDDLHAKDVGEEEMANGIELGGYYAGEALRLFSSNVCDPDLVLAQNLLDWLQNRGDEYVSLTQIYQHGPMPIREAKIARRIAGVLADHGWLAPVEGGKIVDGKPRREVWHLIDGGRSS